MQQKEMNLMEIKKVQNAYVKSRNMVFFKVDTALGKSMNMSLSVIPFHKIKV